MKRSRALLACPVIRYKFILDFAACYYYFQHSCKSFICKYIGVTDHWFHSRFHFFISVFPVLHCTQIGVSRNRREYVIVVIYSYSRPWSVILPVVVKFYYMYSPYVLRVLLCTLYQSLNIFIVPVPLYWSMMYGFSEYCAECALWVGTVPGLLKPYHYCLPVVLHVLARRISGDHLKSPFMLELRISEEDTPYTVFMAESK